MFLKNQLIAIATTTSYAQAKIDSLCHCLDLRQRHG